MDFTPVIYELTEHQEPADVTLDGLFLRKLDCPPQDVERYRQEASRWQVVEHVSYEKTLYWRGDAQESGGYTVIHQGAWVVADGAFFGFLVGFRDEDSMGISHRESPKQILLAVDGRVFGDTVRQKSHSSDEVDVTEEGSFTLEKVR